MWKGSGGGGTGLSVAVWGVDTITLVDKSDKLLVIEHIKWKSSFALTIKLTQEFYIRRDVMGKRYIYRNSLAQLRWDEMW